MKFGKFFKYVSAIGLTTLLLSTVARGLLPLSLLLLMVEIFLSPYALYLCFKSRDRDNAKSAMIGLVLTLLHAVTTAILVALLL